MENNNPESAKGDGENRLEVIPSVIEVGRSTGPIIIQPSMDEDMGPEPPFVPQAILEVAPDDVVPTGELSRPESAFDKIDGTGALQGQFEGANTTAAAVARHAVIEFNRLKEK
ncbi:hypothetical protein A2810_00385 [candidate division Kazan bacterium RIFCSPHIGHO2_01_FULL_49_10]|uniref:Uncharacterized protein n=1 Tax=candidate division Kazan bacterium RIFCSPLOWO2_01_FULL_48_13 TaxID=1798539 RepID=A0A1F4PPK6_UNCK3|nr:MAG: hypothetical protein A2810_00385 [candidate division Kazan bacterium RIFCSPHIGHO2_01_FULL_49_10]OGB85555.1 MAG: hypothetical protein A2994_00835 [candidate division Kazan bacterium RIFCSPLOWO2_01_FULL_48_13]